MAEADTESLSSLTSRAKSHATNTYADAQRSLLDRVIDPSARRKAYDASYEYASAQPLIFSAAVTLVVFSALPILLFSVFAIAVAAAALGGAILFTLFWIGVGFLVLVPALCLTGALALLVWAWAAGSFVVGRAVYRAVVVVEGPASSGGGGVARVHDDDEHLHVQGKHEHSYGGGVKTEENGNEPVAVSTEA